MKKLVFTLTILIAVPFVPAHAYDWKIASQRARDDESAVRINWQGHSYLTDRLSVGPSQTRRITLIRNAGKNGYTTTRQGDLIYFQAANVEDPSSGKLLAGLKQLEYQCPGNPASKTVNLQFSNGHSDRINVSCLALIKPRIILREERSEPN